MVFSSKIFQALCGVLLLVILTGAWLSLRSEPVVFLGQTLTWPSLADRSVEEQAPEKISEPVTLLFGGDLMFDRYIRTVATRRGDAFILEPLRELLQAADLVVANLEGPITAEPSVSETSEVGARANYVFTFPSTTAELLKREHIELVNLGNNHILNFKASGVEETKGFLDAAEVGYFGSPLPGDERYAIVDIRGMYIAFVNYNEFVYQGEEKALEDIRTVEEAADLVVLYTHRGKEYVPVLPEVKELAHRFIEAGADLIIGSHPHIIQDKEEYQGKMIYYSLGNMVFDQYFSPETQNGLLAEVTIDPADKKITFKEIPVYLRSNGQTELVSPLPI